MTAAPAAAGGDEYRGWRRLAMRLGHLSAVTSTWVVPALMLFLLVELWAPNAVAAGLCAVNVGLSAVYVTFMFLQDFVHSRGLCFDCLNRAPLLDPQAAIDKARGRLRYFHFHYRRLRLAVFAGLGTYMLPMIFDRDLMRAGVPVVVVHALASALVVFSVVVDMLAFWVIDTHRRLHTWCPWCRRRGKDHPAVAPTPVPAGTV